jgi:hypothetical protein
MSLENIIFPQYSVPRLMTEIELDGELVEGALTKIGLDSILINTYEHFEKIPSRRISIKIKNVVFEANIEKCKIAGGECHLSIRFANYMDFSKWLVFVKMISQKA